MYHNNIEIKEGAFFITDAHYSSKNPHFLNFLQEIHSKKLLPTQIIFMGDIFDALFGSITKTCEKNKEAIEIINDLSGDIEIIYLEGNHDFNLHKIFPKVKLFRISQQPVKCSLKDKELLIAHGDFDGTFFYKLYTALIRNRVMLKFLNIFDLFILKKLDQYLGKKDDCKKLNWFDAFIKRRIENRYECDYFIEGHYHQNKSIDLNNCTYINLGAFACNQRYFIVESSQDKNFLREKIFQKET